MTFILRHASQMFSPEKIEIDTNDFFGELKKLQKMHGHKLVINTENDWFGLETSKTYNTPSIVIYDDYLE